jgi:hypothetical protein
MCDDPVAWRIGFFRIRDAGSGDLSASHAQTSRPSAPRCQLQTSRCVETGIGSSANRRTRLVAFGATIPGAIAGRISRFGAVILSASFYSDRLHRPRRRDGRRALRSSASPEFHGSPARHRDTLTSPRQSVVTSSVEQPQKFAPGSCQGPVDQTDTVGRPTRLDTAEAQPTAPLAQPCCHFAQDLRAVLENPDLPYLTTVPALGDRHAYRRRIVAGRRGGACERRFRRPSRVNLAAFAQRVESRGQIVETRRQTT